MDKEQILKTLGREDLGHVKFEELEVAWYAFSEDPKKYEGTVVVSMVNQWINEKNAEYRKKLRYEQTKRSRAKAILAMETLAREVADEGVIMGWLMYGVADGDIDDSTTIEDVIELGYTDDKTYEEVSQCFFRTMANAKENGGFF